MQVQVLFVYPAPGQTVWTADGVDVESGEPVSFAGDWRPMSELAAVVANSEDDVLAEVPDWAVLA